MNLVFFSKPFKQADLEATDPRAIHIRSVLQANPGDRIYVAFAGECRALCEVYRISASGRVGLSLVETEPAPEPLPVTLLIGLPRPHTARKILYDGAMYGVRKMIFFESETGEPSYRQSRLWSTGEANERMIAGVAQSFAAHLPEVVHAETLAAGLEQIADGDAANRLAMDNYEATSPLAETVSSLVAAGNRREWILAFGAERGWSPAERETLRASGYAMAHLGPRVFRLEAAVQASLAVTAASAGWWTEQTK